MYHAISRRAAIARLMSGGVAIGAAGAAPATLLAATSTGMRLSDGTLTIEVDAAMRTRIARNGAALTDWQAAQALHLTDGRTLDRFLLLDNDSAPAPAGPHGPGRRHRLRATASGAVEQQIAVTFLDRYPGLALLEIAYRNTGSAPIGIAGWRSVTHDLLPHPDGAWAFAGASYADRRDWIQPVKPGFTQRNFMGMNASDYGGGTPVAVVWRRDAGIAVGHLDTVPRLVSLPVASQPNGTRIGIAGDEAAMLAPGATLTLPPLFVMVHSGDHYRPLDAYRRLMAERGVSAPTPPESSYAPIWCAWGYERGFTAEQVTGTLAKAKSVGLEWAVLDDGWQTAEGDWYVDRRKFPGGGADMKALADSIKRAGMRPRLWLAPLAVDPGTDLLRDHPDMLLLDAQGTAQNVTFWNAFTLCPGYQPTVDHFRGIVRRIVGEWGFEGLKLDGQHLNGVAPCHNPAHRHAHPGESIEKLQDFWKALYDEALAANPQAVVEICPCGDSFAFHNLPATNNTPASDPLSSWQIRLKGKTFKAFYCGYPFSFGQIGASVVRPGDADILQKLPGNFPRRFPFFDIDTYLAALPRADANPAILNPNSCLDATGATIPGCTLTPYPAGYSTQVIEPNLPASYRIKERTWAGYAMLNFQGARWRADVGARLIATKVSSVGYGASIASIIPRAGTQDNDVDFNPVEPIVGGGDYLRVLPAANVAFDLAEGLRLRLAASQAISRPTFAELSPAKDATSAQSGTFIIYDAGNPNLKPTSANQLDVSLEYYPSNRLALTAAAFYKRITSFVSTVPVDVVVTPTAQPANQQPSFDFVEYQVRNGDSATVYGLEVGGQYFLDSGFGVQANLTYNRSRARSGDVTTDLPGAIPFSANGKLFYENNGIAAQVSYSFQSRFTFAQSGNLAYLPVKEDPYHEVSATLSYDLTKNISVYAQGSNLLGQAVRRFNDYRNVPNFYEYSGRAFFFGLRGRL